MLAEDLQIQEDAFQEAANSKFCYLDPPRRHAFGRLLSGLYEGDGLFLLTGRAGIGKTVLLHHLSEQLKALDGVLPLYPMQVFACRSGTTLADVFGACQSRLGLGESATAPLKATKKLQQRVESDRSPVLLLDDADLLGDGVLATFPSAAQAIDGARRCLALSAASELGLHAGDVIREEGNVFGGAVNIASRICGLSAPGEILVSDVVRGMARSSAGVEFEDRGEQGMKGVGEPVRVYAVRAEG